MSTSNSTTFSNIALFVDIENFVVSALEIGLPVDLEPVINKLLETGRVSIRRAFGDLDAVCKQDQKVRAQIKRMLAANLIQYEEVPYITPQKNTADMRLSVEALSVAYTYDNIDCFAIVSSDRDYAPLIAKLKELGRRVIGIGSASDTVNELYVRSCDQFIYHSSLLQSAPVQESTAPPQAVDPLLVDAYIKLLCDAVNSLDQRGTRPVGAVLVPLMRQMKPDYDLSLVGFRSLRALVEEAERRGVCKSSPAGGDILVTLASTATPVSYTQVKFYSDQTPDAKEVRTFLEQKLNCRIPGPKDRSEMYKRADKIIRQCVAAGKVIDLADLSKEIEPSFYVGVARDPGVGNSVFKILYSLFRQKVFETEPSERPYHPLIKHVVTEPDEWDRLFVKNQIVVLRQSRPTWNLKHEMLAELFQVSEKLIEGIMADIYNEQDRRFGWN